MPEALTDPWDADSLTLIVAVVVPALLGLIRWKRGFSPSFSRRRYITDFLLASAIVPFVLLLFSVRVPAIFDYMKASKLPVGLAGAVGLFFVVGELLTSAAEKAHYDHPHEHQPPPPPAGP